MSAADEPRVRRDRDAIRLAISDPGSFVGRGDNYTESIPSWQTRAVLALLADAGLLKD